MNTANPTSTALPADTVLPATLGTAELEAFRRNGYLLLEGYFDAVRDRIVEWLVDMQTWPETPGRWMMYYETPTEGAAAGQRMLCRLENFLDDHAGLESLLRHPALMGILSQLMGEPAVLFKEKINFKLPGGQGFAPHQDAPAFVAFNQRYHITAMIGIDHATPENGCLEVVSDLGLSTLLPQEADGTIEASAAGRLTWAPLPTRPGDLLLFDSYLPHRSGPNRANTPRRALYVTYNRLSEGARRTDYFRDKREKFPPECERVASHDYSAGAAIYNLANPIHR